MSKNGNHYYDMFSYDFPMISDQNMFTYMCNAVSRYCAPAYWRPLAWYSKFWFPSWSPTEVHLGVHGSPPSGFGVSTSFVGAGPELYHLTASAWDGERASVWNVAPRWSSIGNASGLSTQPCSRTGFPMGAGRLCSALTKTEPLLQCPCFSQTISESE